MEEQKGLVIHDESKQFELALDEDEEEMHEEIDPEEHINNFCIAAPPPGEETPRRGSCSPNRTPHRTPASGIIIA